MQGSPRTNPHRNLALEASDEKWHTFLQTLRPIGPAQTTNTDGFTCNEADVTA
jgi:hypothetical protein